MNLLIYFALPLATILLAIVLQKVLENPILVAITFFAIYLIVAFVLSILNILDLGTGIVLAIIYSIIAFITALIIQCFCNNNDIDFGSICTNTNDNSSSCGCNRIINNEAINNNMNSTIDIDNFSNNRNLNIGRCYSRRRF